MTNLTTHTTNTSKYYLDINQESVSRLVSIADNAIDQKDSWQSFTIKSPTGKEKKFQVKLSTSDDGNNREVSIRRNNLAAKLSRSRLLRRFLANKPTEETSKYEQAQAILKRYVLSRHSIRKNSDVAQNVSALKPAHQHLLTPTQLQQSAEPFRTSSGITHIIEPSKVIEQIRQDTSAKDQIAIVIGLEGTLCRSEGIDSAASEQARLLDSEMPKAIKKLKNERPEIRLILSSQKPHTQKNDVLEQLRKCGLTPNDFDLIHCDGDPEFEYEHPTTQGQIANSKSAVGKKECLLSSLNKLAEEPWLPSKVVMIDQSNEELKDVAQSCREFVGSELAFQAYQTHLDQHLTYLKENTPDANREGANALYQVHQASLGESQTYHEEDLRDEQTTSRTNITEHDTHSTNVATNQESSIAEQISLSGSRSVSPDITIERGSSSEGELASSDNVVNEQSSPSENEEIHLNSNITEKDLLDRAPFAAQHYYMMLRG
ncbi:hypothetical protein SOPP22_16930 [Shewanella sp. OPT22]|nr:hypothetical protein SOPP22_16930 [Shewanella sp. OPT22]